MRLILNFLLIALFALPAHASDELPSGEFVLVNSVLPGPMQRATVPVYVHMTVTDRRMEFRFIPTGMLDALSCKETRKCEQVVNALGVDYALEEDRVVVTDHEIRTGSVIDHHESDLPLIIEPMLQLVDGATVTLGENEIAFRTSNGSNARFLASNLEDARDAMAFARIWEVSLHDLDRCVVRQISELRLRDEGELSEAEHNLLEAVEVAGLTSDLHQVSQYWAMMPDAPEANSPEVLRQRMAASYLRVMPLVIGQYPDATPEKAQTMAMEWLSEAESFDASVFDEYVVPHREGLLQLGRYHVWFRELLTEGEDPVEHLCGSLLLD